MQVLRANQPTKNDGLPTPNNNTHTHAGLGLGMALLVAPAFLRQTGLPAVSSVQPLRVHHQGGTLITISGSGFSWNGTDAGNLRCCWDAHEGLIDVTTSVGDGLVDETTAVESVTDSLIVCRTYERIPGHTHTARLLLSFAPTCADDASLLVDTLGYVQYYLDTVAMQLASLSPRGGPLQGGTAVTVRGAGYGGSLRCRFGHYSVVATYVDAGTLVCTSPDVSAAPLTHTGPVALDVTPNGHEYTIPLTFTFYDTATARVSSVWPLGGPSAGGGVITVRGSGFAQLDRLSPRASAGVSHGYMAVLLGEGGTPIRARLLNESTLLATVGNFSASAPVVGTPVELEGGGFSSGGYTSAERGGLRVLVSLNGDVRGGDLLQGDAFYRYCAARGHLNPLLPLPAPFPAPWVWSRAHLSRGVRVCATQTPRPGCACRLSSRTAHTPEEAARSLSTARVSSIWAAPAARSERCGPVEASTRHARARLASRPRGQTSALRWRW